jgi:hypothetical protein
VNLRFWQKRELYGATIHAGQGSLVSGFPYPYVRPEVDFATCYEYYRTVGKVQNAVESYVAKILSRDWYYEGEQGSVKALEEWEERFNLSRIIEYIVRDWLVCGNSIIGTSDWQPVQMTSVVGIKRTPYGMTEQFVQHVNGKEVTLDAGGFIHTPYIEVNREAWGIGMFHSLLATFSYRDRRSLPHLEIYRRQIQLFYRILERYGSPVTVWFFENVAKAEFEKQVKELQALEPGDRRILSKKVEIATETIDGRGDLINATTPVINEEIEAGLQTSANRLITRPSAMADARIGSEYDDSRTTAIMEKIRRTMNALVIPKVTSGRVEFRWGKKDNFEFDFDQLLQAKSAGLVSAEEGRAILQSVGWKLDDNLAKTRPLQSKEVYSAERICQALYDVLREFNSNHDPDNGQFTSSGGSTRIPTRGGTDNGRSNRKPNNVDYAEAKTRFEKFDSKTEKREYSFDPATNKSYDVRDPAEAKAFHAEYADGDCDVYVIAVTNNTRGLNKKTEEAYNRLLDEGKRPFIGKWKDPLTGRTYTDISFPVSGNDVTDDYVKNLLSDNKQLGGIAVTEKGNVRLVA